MGNISDNSYSTPTFQIGLPRNGLCRQKWLSHIQICLACFGFLIWPIVEFDFLNFSWFFCRSMPNIFVNENIKKTKLAIFMNQMTKDNIHTLVLVCFVPIFEQLLNFSEWSLFLEPLLKLNTSKIKYTQTKKTLVDRLLCWFSALSFRTVVRYVSR